MRITFRRGALWGISLGLFLSLGLSPLPAQTSYQIGNYELSVDEAQTSNNGVQVTWDGASQTLTVTYLNEGDFFTLPDPQAPQGTRLLKADLQGTYRPVAGVECRILEVAQPRQGEVGEAGPGPHYASLVLGFYKGDDPYAFAEGGDYAVDFDIPAGTLHHKSMPDQPFKFSIPRSQFSWQKASDWAQGDLFEAEKNNLIPPVLQGADLTKAINRAEFAAICVRLYEALSGRQAIEPVDNPFRDCQDPDVLKAYHLGAVEGTSPTTYSPQAILNREQAATMLTRVFKKVALLDWSLATDSYYTLEFPQPQPFADEEAISPWARQSVHFMVACKILRGLEGNRFAPRNLTPQEEKWGWANATREQALLIAMRIVQNLKNSIPSHPTSTFKVE